MANLTSFIKVGTTNRTRQDNNVPYLAEVYIDWAQALAAKGTALAASDTVEAISVPAGTVVLSAGLQCIVPDNATALTMDLGYTGGTVDHWVDGFDHGAASAGAYGFQVTSGIIGDGPVAPQSSAQVISVLLATLTGTLSVGKTRVFAVLQDVNPASSKKDVGIAKVGS